MLLIIREKNSTVRDRTPTQETGFLAELRAVTNNFGEKTRFLATRSSESRNRVFGRIQPCNDIFW
ncbi:MAG: hypothetical protein EAZ19_23670 [Oscillatoriales cyanobacterium]|jgi:hypothetical protein|uniref:hypothetical protein n=1 Tax=unclassified Microcoleus TaxID=2642155 RepID=UPI001DEB6B6C|nr:MULTISPECIES: hypothetical protein [unclassified Microcoleus]MCC3504281.1 hypothetical protein [Microcoleus sp. PH2017_19_SFW_U_A]MCC3522041.1 hypothetical protein [Microcoleus sp. PH2017_20_SFW_D_A]MCC3553040.1 hypothetical protein [Microcoleus sp. PH2017_35_SFW_U_B]TAG89679.1 MAG: hypothetical protein EAZ19_23670 [Oscillatoriales cyanobacterium]MCC3470630.1 hypothetical protein [Microcoleus sp. PH2017_13_LAR_U_A]